ncbi:MAG: InlB B-repeat-containing protein, partial [Spirochaetales bacterium]|nr:InlB B-repeat-containing protein [Spirochaetales bacterium]
MGNLTVLKGEAANLPENKYERTDGYSFIGWNTKADGSGDSYTDGDTVCFES